MRSNASRVTRPDGCAEHQVNGTSSWRNDRDSWTNPAAGRLMPCTAASNAGPRVKPGHASGASKSAMVAKTCENVFVSCWKPPTAMRATYVSSWRGHGGPTALQHEYPSEVVRP